MKLEAGKRYVRRDGTVSNPLVFGLFGFLCDTGTLMHFDPEDKAYGWMVRPESKQTHDHDLMAPYEEQL